MDGYQHYVRVDENGIIIYGFTTGFEQPQPGDLLISGQTGRHFTILLMNERGQYIFKLVNNAITARSQEELDAELAARPPEPKTSDQMRIEQLEADNADLWYAIMTGGA